VKQKRKDKMDAKKQAQELANMGRYGDTMLMHVNPKEVEGLASIMPITINPQTGQPEAFIGAILGSLIGGTVFPNLLSMGIVGAAGGAALGSGLGTYAETGDLEKGLASAVLGYGVGNILGDVGTSGLVEAETQIATDAALQEAGKQVSEEAIRNAALNSNLTGEVIGKEALKKLGQDAGQAFMDAGVLSNPQTIKIADAANVKAQSEFMNMTTGDRLGEIGSNIFSGNTVDAVSNNYLPIALGGGSLSAQNAQEEYEREMAEYRANKDKRKEELYAKYPEQIHKRNPYYDIYGVAEGGQIPSYAEGETVYGVGSEGQYRPSNTYMPGFDSEFNYFPNRVIPASAISARQAAKGETPAVIAPNPITSRYQPMVLPNYAYDQVPAGSVLGRVQDAYNAGLPTTTQLLSPFRNTGLDTVIEGAGRSFINKGTGTGTDTGTGTTTQTNTG
tara:strand:+ start:3170 stop:4510 length:1341 start_codon:yes stop_codon:yes gene_type:complete